MIIFLVLAAIDLETKRVDTIEVRPRLELAEEGSGPGRARVRLEFDLIGPNAIELIGPRLEDAFDAWRVRIASSSWSEGRLTRSILLDQIKPGQLPLPGFVLRVRPSASANWQELSWPEPLAEPRTVSRIEVTPSTAPESMGWWPWIIAVITLIMTIIAWKTRSGLATTELDAETEALAALDQSTPDEVERVLRRYVSRRFGIDAFAFTRSELLTAIAGRVNAADALLEEALQRCEEARYGGLPDQGQAARLARQYVAKMGLIEKMAKNESVDKDCRCFGRKSI